LRRGCNAVAGLCICSRSFLEKLLFLSLLILVPALAATLARGNRLALRNVWLQRRLRGNLRLPLWLSLGQRLWRLNSVCLAAFVLAAAAAAPMPLRLPLAIGRVLPQFRLRLS
jgi:hypothetical protein